jgi:hypothetical protein
MSVPFLHTISCREVEQVDVVAKRGQSQLVGTAELASGADASLADEVALQSLRLQVVQLDKSIEAAS